jgi:hypothetical protein
VGHIGGNWAATSDAAEAVQEPCVTLIVSQTADLKSIVIS